MYSGCSQSNTYSFLRLGNARNPSVETSILTIEHRIRNW